MSGESNDLEMRAAFEKKAGALFSEGPLSEKIRLLYELQTTPSVGLFLTAVPWLIEVPGQEPITGFSETMRFALREATSDCSGFRARATT